MVDLPGGASLTNDISIRTFIDNLQVENDNLILALHAIENHFGFVPRESSLLLSRRFAVPLARIYEVITFYHYFRTTPAAEKNLTVCLGTSCWLQGSEKLLQYIKSCIDHLPFQQKQQFGISEVRCVGCCSLSPLLFAGKKVIPNATFEKMDQLISDLLSETKSAGNII